MLKEKRISFHEKQIMLNGTFKATTQSHSSSSEATTHHVMSYCICFLNIFRGRDHLYFPNPQKNKDESLENLMPKTNTSHNHQTALNPSSQEPSGHPTSDMLSGWLTTDQIYVNVVYNCMMYVPVSNSRAWKQVEKCSGGISFEK